MTKNVENEISMKMYLLGELTEAERQVLEERLMTSNECFGELSIAEDRLVDEYLMGRLSAREKDKFNDYFLCTPERRQKLRFSRSLHRYVLANAEKPQTLWSWPGFLPVLRFPQRIMEWSLAGALSLIMLGGSWVTFRIQRLEQLLELVRSQQTVPGGQQQDLQQQLAQLRGRNDQLASELQRQEEQREVLERAALRASPPPRSALSMVSFALTPGGTRDTQGTQGMQKVTIPPSANWVRLQLDIGTGDYKRYQAVLLKDGKEIPSQITPRIKTEDAIEALVPAKLLPHGDYILKLSGIPASGDPEDIGSYTFRVLHK
jgi:cell division protein FtsB